MSISLNEAAEKLKVNEAGMQSLFTPAARADAAAAAGAAAKLYKER